MGFAVSFQVVFSLLLLVVVGFKLIFCLLSSSSSSSSFHVATWLCHGFRSFGIVLKRLLDFFEDI